MTGMYLRVKRGNEYKAIEIEYLTSDEREVIFEKKTKAEMMRWINAFCNWLTENVKEA